MPAGRLRPARREKAARQEPRQSGGCRTSGPKVTGREELGRLSPRHGATVAAGAGARRPADGMADRGSGTQRSGVVVRIIWRGLPGVMESRASATGMAGRPRCGESRTVVAPKIFCHQRTFGRPQYRRDPRRTQDVSSDRVFLCRSGGGLVRPDWPWGGKRGAGGTVSAQALREAIRPTSQCRRGAGVPSEEAGHWHQKARVPRSEVSGSAPAPGGQASTGRLSALCGSGACAGGLSAVGVWQTGTAWPKSFVDAHPPMTLSCGRTRRLPGLTPAARLRALVSGSRPTAARSRRGPPAHPVRPADAADNRAALR